MDFVSMILMIRYWIRFHHYLKSILAGKHLIEARFLPWIKIMS